MYQIFVQIVYMIVNLKIYLLFNLQKRGLKMNKITETFRNKSNISLSPTFFEKDCSSEFHKLLHFGLMLHSARARHGSTKHS